MVSTMAEYDETERLWGEALVDLDPVELAEAAEIVGDVDRQPGADLIDERLRAGDVGRVGVHRERALGGDHDAGAGVAPAERGKALDDVTVPGETFTCRFAAEALVGRIGLTLAF